MTRSLAPCTFTHFVRSKPLSKLNKNMPFSGGKRKRYGPFANPPACLPWLYRPVGGYFVALSGRKGREESSSFNTAKSVRARSFASSIDGFFFSTNGE